MDWTRRDFLGKTLAAGTAALAAGPIAAMVGDKRDDLEPFHWARLKFELVNSQAIPDKWNVHPWGDIFFLEMLQKHTNLNVDRTWHVAPLDNLNEMVKYPFLFMTTEGDFKFTQKHQKNLVEYLTRGGFIYADDCVLLGSKQPGVGDKFFLCLKNKLETLFRKKMTPLPNDHAIYKSYFQLNGLPYMQGVNHPGEALFLDGRMALFLTSTDIHCGWCSMSMLARKQEGWFPRNKSMDSIKMGINVLVHAMTR
jgi:hypothetical protein